MTPPKSRPVAILLLLLTIAPLAGIALWVYVFIWPGTWGTMPQAVEWFWFVVAFEAVVAVGALGVALYYILLVFSATPAESERYFWVVTLLSWYPIVAPIFWYRVIWKQMPVSLATIRA